jgi:hypothetical protein
MCRPIEWLQEKQPGFKALQPCERDAVMHFALLWSLFEAKALSTRANAKRIVEMADELSGKRLVENKVFEEALSYFRGRYVNEGIMNEKFDQLDFRPCDKKDLVEGVLVGAATDEKSIIASLFIIVWRLRNNLFNGKKWDYELNGEFDNFTQANLLLMGVLELYAGK